MRRPITAQAPLFDVRAFEPEIDAISADFDHYLGLCPPPTSASKHAVMGAIGKVLSEVKSGRDDRASLKGYALRVHEAKQQFPSPDAVIALESGIDKLVDLLHRDDVPIVARDIVLDRIDYGLYYLRRKQQIEGRERYNQDFRQYLRERYASLSALSEAWATTIPSWDRVHAFGQKSREYTQAGAVKQRDMDGFREERRRLSADPQVELEEEEETS